LGAPPFAYALPLVHALQRSGQVHLEEAMPDDLADRIREGSLDGALLPVLDCLDVPRARVLPGVGVATETGTGMDIVSARAPLASVRTVAYDRRVGGALGLSRLMLPIVVGKDLEFVALDPGQTLPEAVDAVLVCGGLPEAWVEFGPNRADLASAWQASVALPFVHAVWLAAAGAPMPLLRRIVGVAARCEPDNDQDDAGLALDSMATATSPDKIGPDGVHYMVGSAEMDSICAYLDWAAERDLCVEGARLRLC
jgi:predicted solute-binding protein